MKVIDDPARYRIVDATRHAASCTSPPGFILQVLESRFGMSRSEAGSVRTQIVLEDNSLFRKSELIVDCGRQREFITVFAEIDVRSKRFGHSGSQVQTGVRPTLNGTESQLKSLFDQFPQQPKEAYEIALADAVSPISTLRGRSLKSFRARMDLNPSIDKLLIVSLMSLPFRCTAFASSTLQYGCLHEFSRLELPPIGSQPRDGIGVQST